MGMQGWPTCRLGHMLQVLLLQHVIQPIVDGSRGHHGHQGRRASHIQGRNPFVAYNAGQHGQWVSAPLPDGCAEDSRAQHIQREAAERGSNACSPHEQFMILCPSSLEALVVRLIGLHCNAWGGGYLV